VGKILKVFGVKLEIKLLFDPDADTLLCVSQMVAEAMATGHVATKEGVQNEPAEVQYVPEPNDFAADSVLSESIQFRHFPASALAFPGVDDADVAWKSVFLTGATGYVGAHLLGRLLTQTSAKIVCIVRADSDVGAMQRVMNTLSQYKIFPDLEQRARIMAVPGNLGEAQFGLSDEVYGKHVAFLTANANGLFVHCGATVNLMMPYRAIRKVNVGGTMEVLQLASTVHNACQGNVGFAFISSLGVFPENGERRQTSVTTTGEDEIASSAFVEPVQSEQDVHLNPEALKDGYCQTKWVSENLVREAGRRGLDCAVFRLGTMAPPDSPTGVGNPNDFYVLFLTACWNMGAFPELAGDFMMEMTPVDFAVAAIVRGSETQFLDDNLPDELHPFHMANARALKHETDHIYHVVNPAKVSYRSLVKDMRMGAYATEGGLVVEDFSLWKKKLAAKYGEEGKLLALLGGVETAEQFIDICRPLTNVCEYTLAVINQGLTTRALRKLRTDCPPVDRRLLSQWMRQFHTSDDFFTTAKSPVDNSAKLAGRIALVTGASSGIGAGIARRLAAAGAHVVCCARRKPELDSLVNEIITSGGRAISVVCDVTDLAAFHKAVGLCYVELGAPIDILVSCSGLMAYAHMKNVSLNEESWVNMIDVNCKGVLHGVAACLPGMLEGKRGDIISISSDAGRKVFPGLSVYSATKHFVEALSRGLRFRTHARTHAHTHTHTHTHIYMI
jgi:thioester reductase-like protein